MGPVQVWRLYLDPPPKILVHLERLLSADEQRRAERLHDARHRSRFVAARGLLRYILSAELPGTSPDSLVFSYGEQGKPALAEPALGRRLGFSLSHSREQALLAVGWHRTLGIDIEAVRPETEVDAIAGRFFSANEVTALRSLPAPNARRAGFFRCWTRKEAYIKALGSGVFRGLDTFDVSLGAEHSPALLADRQDPAAPSRWSMVAVAAPAGFEAALVIDAPTPATIELLEWDWQAMVGRALTKPPTLLAGHRGSTTPGRPARR